MLNQRETIRTSILRMLLLLAMFALTFVSCAKNAILDLVITPPVLDASSPEITMTVDVRRNDADFMLQWSGSQAGEPMTLARGSASQQPRFELSIETTDIPEAIYARVQFWRDYGASSQEVVGEMWLTISSPFYQGKFTALSLPLDHIPTCVNDDCGSAASVENTPNMWDCSPRTLPSTIGNIPVWDCQIRKCDIGCGDVENSEQSGGCRGGRDDPNEEHYCEG